MELSEARAPACERALARGTMAGVLLLKFRKEAPQTPPTTLVLDRQGRVAARFVGPVTATKLLIPVQVIAKDIYGNTSVSTKSIKLPGTI